jgi:hypothetical protein
VYEDIPTRIVRKNSTVYISRKSTDLPVERWKVGEAFHLSTAAAIQLPGTQSGFRNLLLNRPSATVAQSGFLNQFFCHGHSIRILEQVLQHQVTQFVLKNWFDCIRISSLRTLCAGSNNTIHCLGSGYSAFNQTICLLKPFPWHQIIQTGSQGTTCGLEPVLLHPVTQSAFLIWSVWFQ